MIPKLVPVHLLQDIMPKVAMYLEKAIAEGQGLSEWSPGAIAASAGAGQSHVWVDDFENPRYVMTAQVKHFRRGPVYYIFLIGGEGDGHFDVDEWKEAWRTIRTYTNSMQIPDIASVGRKGWRRHFQCEEIGTIVLMKE